KVLNMNDKWDFTITGVTQNPASNSTLPFDIAIHFDYRIKEAASLGADPFSWGWWSPNTFIKLDKTASIESFNSKMTALFQAKMREHDNDFFNLLPLTERRFFFWDTRQYIIIFSAIALLVLFIANINFINLMTAQSANRVKEIGIRKVSGAVRKSLIYQFLGESLILTIISLFFALLIAGLLLPFFNSITGKQFAPDMVLRPTIICLLTGLVLITGFASGGYPALLLSSFKPIMMLKRQPLVFSGAGLRKSLVVMQFSISIALIICAGAVFSQLRYIKSKDIGYAKEQLITISLKGEGQEFYDTLRKKLESDHRILGVTGMADDLPHFSWTSSTQHWEGKDQTREIHLGFNMVDYNIVNTLELKLVEGKDFTSEFLTANETGFLINEKLADLIGRESIVGRPFSSFDKTGKIMGVFQNTHFLPLTTQINPFYFMFSRERLFNMVIRIPNENLQASVQFIKESWKEIIPMYPFEYRFVDETFDRAYSNIERMDKLVNVFTVIAIVLACLGLFCLALFTIEQRTKEIGIRKILGAYVPGIVIMLSKEFLKWVVLANIFAWPVAFLIIHKWLENFAYRIQLNVRLFLLSGGLALIIAIITISWQAVGAAMAPPVRALRYE
ncbi:FtsX-like permease family protein, partial [candidate division KSB1 bacterium]|nr:FtsX-like permease family protein [candidate division KSB1 bacterium]